MKTCFATVPPSGTGVTESLALGEAPFTRISSVGILVIDPLLGDSALLGMLSGFGACPSIDNTEMTTTNKYKNRELIFILRIEQMQAGGPGVLTADYL